MNSGVDRRSWAAPSPLGAGGRARDCFPRAPRARGGARQMDPARPSSLCSSDFLRLFSLPITSHETIKYSLRKVGMFSRHGRH